jgi:hypothetical protein
VRGPLSSGLQARHRQTAAPNDSIAVLQRACLRTPFVARTPFISHNEALPAEKLEEQIHFRRGYHSDCFEEADNKAAKPQPRNRLLWATLARTIAILAAREDGEPLLFPTYLPMRFVAISIPGVRVGQGKRAAQRPPLPLCKLS